MVLRLIWCTDVSGLVTASHPGTVSFCQPKIKIWVGTYWAESDSSLYARVMECTSCYWLFMFLAGEENLHWQSFFTRQGGSVCQVPHMPVPWASYTFCEIWVLFCHQGVLHLVFIIWQRCPVEQGAGNGHLVSIQRAVAVHVCTMNNLLSPSREKKLGLFAYLPSPLHYVCFLSLLLHCPETEAMHCILKCCQ